MDKEKKRVVCRVMYAVIFVTASVPLACNYVLNGKDVLMWLARVEELKSSLQRGHFLWFPSAELVNAYGGQSTALNSNFWLLLPVLVRLCGGSITLAFRLFMLAVNAVTLFTTKKMFESLFTDRLTAMYGMAFYMLCPYRIWLCYDQIDLGRCVAWMLIPLLVWAAAGLCANGFSWSRMLLGAAVLAGTGYADGVMALILAGLLLFACLWYRRAVMLPVLIVGGILFLPGGMTWLRYLLMGGMEEYNLPLDTISAKGYVVGEFFSSYTFWEGHPGLGLGLLGALLLLMWLLIMDGKRRTTGTCGFFTAASVVLLCMSLSRFPWDFVQRVCGPLLRLVALIGSPNVFFGFACIALSVPAAYGLESLGCPDSPGSLGRQRPLFVRVGLPICIITAVLGVSLYLCNMLTYTRLPLYLLDSLN